jgi:uncharacterized protein YjbJ (UPF0337 family)
LTDTGAGGRLAPAHDRRGGHGIGFVRHGIPKTSDIAARRGRLKCARRLGRWAPGEARSDPMNWDRIEGSWKQVKGKVKEQWGRLTDDDIDIIAGKRDQLIGKIQEQYGISKDEAEKQVEQFGGRIREDDFGRYQ